MEKTILIVEDDTAVRRTIVRALSRDNYNILEAPNGQIAMEQIASASVDIVIIDLGLPDIDGFDLVRKIRAENDIGILILSGRQDTIDKVIGIEVGADDYLAKPFDNRELAARVKSIGRRLAGAISLPMNTENPTYSFEGWKLCEDSRTITNPGGEVVDMTSGEFDLALLFVKSAGRALSRNYIMDHLYGDRTPAFDRSVDVRVGRLRKKLAYSNDEVAKIRTIRNIGYMFSCKVTYL